MPKDKKHAPKDVDLKAFIKDGGRKGAEADFNEILKRAVKPTKSSKPKNKK